MEVDETMLTGQLRMGDIGVRVGWGVVSWLYAARDTVAACSHSSTIWHNDGHKLQWTQRDGVEAHLAGSSFSLFPFCLCPYGESDSEELSPSV